MTYDIMQVYSYDQVVYDTYNQGLIETENHKLCLSIGGIILTLKSNKC